MLANWPILHRANICIETTSPLLISCNLASGVRDNDIVRDWRGLPYLPATSITGVLRSVMASEQNADVEQLFGYQEHKSKQGAMSKVSLTNGMVHDQNDQPVSGFTIDSQDPVLALLLQDAPIMRDHVKLNHQGVAEDGAKFDRTLLPKGTRFSFQLSYWQQHIDDETFTKLIQAFEHPSFALGSGAKKGQGQIRVIACQYNIWDLTQHQAEYTEHRKTGKLTQDWSLLSQKPSATIVIEAKTDDFWRFGTGSVSFADDQEKVADTLMYSEKSISWSQHKGQVLTTPQIVLPGTAIKGAIAHRTLFHYLAQQQIFVEDQDFEHNKQKAQIELEQSLLGSVEDSVSGQNQASQFVVSDLYFNDITIVQNIHNSIDRFTGGTRNGALFQQEVAWQTELTINISVSAKAQQIMPEPIKQAFKRTLEDITQGRLALGGSTSKGYGYCTGHIHSQWLGA